jgi:hypothetical protein
MEDDRLIEFWIGVMAITSIICLGIFCIALMAMFLKGWTFAGPLAISGRLDTILVHTRRG